MTSLLVFTFVALAVSGCSLLFTPVLEDAGGAADEKADAQTFGCVGSKLEDESFEMTTLVDEWNGNMVTTSITAEDSHSGGFALSLIANGTELYTGSTVRNYEIDGPYQATLWLKCVNTPFTSSITLKTELDTDFVSQSVEDVVFTSCDEWIEKTVTIEGNEPHTAVILSFRFGDNLDDHVLIDDVCWTGSGDM